MKISFSIVLSGSNGKIDNASLFIEILTRFQPDPKPPPVNGRLLNTV
jgi:hypothetical protein